MYGLLRTLCILTTYPASFCEDGDGASCLNTVREGSARRASLEQKANHTCDLLNSNNKQLAFERMRSVPKSSRTV